MQLNILISEKTLHSCPCQNHPFTKKTTTKKHVTVKLQKTPKPILPTNGKLLDSQDYFPHFTLTHYQKPLNPRALSTSAHTALRPLCTHRVPENRKPDHSLSRRRWVRPRPISKRPKFSGNFP